VGAARAQQLSDVEGEVEDGWVDAYIFCSCINYLYFLCLIILAIVVVLASFHQPFVLLPLLFYP